ncbi:coiled-coil and C2 domain-containing protein 1A isoform X2 [Heterodontus francisci]|uniref:coiled-coil and C2 domain-containing protein 1A isoform X2 n=1 Tax=Heterodontus francisci TaxID=7792 RepID=UPI00355B4487
MNRNKRSPEPKGSGAAKARQLGLLVDFSPDNMMMDVNDDENNADLEAELAAITGEKPASRGKPKGKDPLPMEDIERMAALCMKDLDEEADDDDVDDDDADLMAELNEVLEDDRQNKNAPSPVESKPIPDTLPLSSTISAITGLEGTLAERIDMYRSAINNAKQSGESSKIRRYERGLKTLQSMLASVKKGKQINEEDIPPPVASGKSSNTTSTPPTSGTATSLIEDQSVLIDRAVPREHPVSAAQPAPPPLLPKPKMSVPEVMPPPSVKRSSTLVESSLPAKMEATIPVPNRAVSVNSSMKGTAVSRQREYKLAALQAKRSGDTELATKYYRISKKFDPVLEALDKGETVDFSSLPPRLDLLPKDQPSIPSSQSSTASVPAASPAQPLASSGIPPPKDVMEALQQRMDKYKSAAAQAKSAGNDRKARMHERIVKQYQDAIRAHKAGRNVNLGELPVPPGFPPLQGAESGAQDQSIVGVLENAMKLAHQEVNEGDDEEDELAQWTTALRPAQQARPRTSASGAPPAAPASSGNPAQKRLSNKAQQQLEFLENRKKQFMQAALRTKQKNDIDGAKLYLRQAKGLDPMIEAAKCGLPVDVTKVPAPPANEEDFVLVQRRGVHVPQKTAEQYGQLLEVLKQQYETCMQYSKQYTHLGSVSETTKFEKMADDCKKNIEILKQAHAQGYPLPKYHHEERTFQVVKIFPNLTNSDMILLIVKGINLPSPSGVAPNDLDAFVKFEFAFPNTEEAQRDKTNVVKNTNCPEFKEQFKLNINRGHRAFKRVVQTKGIKFEILHKGGLFKNDRVIGTAQLKLEKLESQCEIREILEVLDGRKTTGGRLEVIVKIREPLSSQQLERVTEKWLVIDPQSLPVIAVPKSKERRDPPQVVGGSKSTFSLHSFNILNFDKERIERKIHVYKQEHKVPPKELLDQHRELAQRIQWQKSQLERRDPGVLKEYITVLEKYLRYYTDAAKRLGTEGNRDLAKEALYKRKLVDDELQRFRR